MHPLLVFSLLCVWVWSSAKVLPLILVAAGVGALLYAFVARKVTAGAPPMSTRRKLMMASWGPSSDGSIYGMLTVNAEPLLAHLEKLSAQGGPKVSVTVAVVRAVALALRECPGMNSRIAFGTFIPRTSIDVSCLVALDDGADLANAKIADTDQKSLQDIAGEIRTKAEKLRAHKDPAFEASKPLLKTLLVEVIEQIIAGVGYLSGALGMNIPQLGVRPFPFGSAMVTSVGMLGVEMALVPFSPFARVPLLITVGEVARKPVVVGSGADERIVAQKQLSMSATLDHRYADGTEGGRFSKKLKLLLENPQMLDIDAPAASSKKPASNKK